MFAAFVLAATIPAIVISATDGDTLKVKAFVWPNVYTEATIRLKGIDAAERNAPCEKARRIGRQAHQELKKLEGETIYLRDVKTGKYSRHIANVFTSRGENIGDTLLNKNLAKPYHGRGPRPDHC